MNEINLDIYDIGQEDPYSHNQKPAIKLIIENDDLYIITKIETDYCNDWRGQNKINLSKLVNILREHEWTI